MSYTLNPSAYSSMVPIPASVIDENLRLAGVCQLKTILFFLRKSTSGSSCSIEDISKAIGYCAEDVEDALIFWQERGLLLSGEIQAPDFVQETLSENKEEKEQSQNKAANKQNEKGTSQVDLPVVKPSFELVANRLSESEEVEFLFNECQRILGRTIGFPGQSTLLMIHDNYGLSVDVILTLVSYAKNSAKTGMQQISAIAKKWSEIGISSVEEAETHIAEQNKLDKLWNDFRALSGVKNSQPTSKQAESLRCWVEEYNFNLETIVLAYEKTIENTGKFSLAYCHKILASWHEKGIEDANQAKQEENSTQKGKPSSKIKKSTLKPSYDLDKYGSIGLNLKKKD